ncbi:hypothetical protein DWF04_013470 [Cereibacter sphaeroides f. sp. denitrificans]
MHILFSCDDDDFAAQDRAELITLLEELARASSRGYHRIIIGRGVARWCRDNIHEASFARTHLIRISEQYAQLKGEYDRASVRLRIELGGAEPSKVSESEWLIGHRAVLNGLYLEPAAIVVEDATNDGSFYEYVLHAEAKRTRYGALQMRFVNGGGNGLYKEFERAIESQQITVCIADHDMLAPKGQRSQTNLKCHVVERKFEGSYVGMLLDTPGREVDNFLPLDIISELPGKRCTKEHQELRRLIDAQGGEVRAGDCLWLYFDVKEGVWSDKYLKKCPDNAALAWIKRKYRAQEEVAFNRIQYPGFKDDIPALFVASNEAKGAFHAFAKSRYWATHFAPWLQKVMSFAAASPRSRT